MKEKTKKVCHLVASILLLFGCSVAEGKTQNIYPLLTVEQRVEFEDILQKTRCLVCQNQNLADSQAPLAKDLRDKIYQRVREGKSKAAVLNYLVQRYGDFVLYEPPLQKNTYLLWGAPILFLAMGLMMLLMLTRQRE